MPKKKQTDKKMISVDDILDKLLAAKKLKVGEFVNLEQKEVEFLISEAQIVISSQPIFLELSAPINICGDIHGQYYDLLRIFNFSGFPPSKNYLFLGDYVDRGSHNIETICLLLAYKIKYPENFFLLRGNHESETINRIYGFFEECKRRYDITLWKKFTFLFNNFPIAALVEDKILCMHGGLSPELIDLNEIKEIKRPTDVPDNGMVCDLLWADPDKEVTGWGENERGVSYTFGADIVKTFCQKQGIELICRGHQVVEDGYEFFCNRKLVTIFSAPNYCDEFDNSAGIMVIDEDLECSLKILEPVEKSI